MMHDGHRNRVRERFLKEGLDHFEPHQILEFLLFYAIPRMDTNEIAHRLINTFGSLSAVLDAPISELVKVQGVGPNAACLLKSIPSLCRRYQSDKSETGCILSSTEEAGNFLLPRYLGRTVEMFSAILLDNKNRVLHWSVISEGNVNSTHVNIRGLAEAVLRYNATGVIIAHNHPNGLAVPSAQDVAMTEQIAAAMSAINVFLADHIVLAADDYISFRDSYQYACYLPANP